MGSKEISSVSKENEVGASRPPERTKKMSDLNSDKVAVSSCCPNSEAGKRFPVNGVENKSQECGLREDEKQGAVIMWAQPTGRSLGLPTVRSVDKPKITGQNGEMNYSRFTLSKGSPGLSFRTLHMQVQAPKQPTCQLDSETMFQCLCNILRHSRVSL